MNTKTIITLTICLSFGLVAKAQWQDFQCPQNIKDSLTNEVTMLQDLLNETKSFSYFSDSNAVYEMIYMQTFNWNAVIRNKSAKHVDTLFNCTGLKTARTKSYTNVQEMILQQNFKVYGNGYLLVFDRKINEKNDLFLKGETILKYYRISNGD